MFSLFFAQTHAVEQTVALKMIRNAVTLMWRNADDFRVLDSIGHQFSLYNAMYADGGMVIVVHKIIYFSQLTLSLPVAVQFILWKT